jgi:hypothetical protein
MTILIYLQCGYTHQVCMGGIFALSLRYYGPPESNIDGPRVPTTVCIVSSEVLQQFSSLAH